MAEAGCWTVEGIGEDFVPPNCRPVAGQEGLFDHRRARASAPRATCCARKASSPARRPARCLPAALRYCREQTEPKRVVTFVCDSGNKYLSKVFNDFWMAEQGLPTSERHGDLRDLVSRSHRRRAAAVIVGPDDTLLTAYRAHARRRRVAAAGARQWQARRHRRRERHCSARVLEGAEERFERAGARRHDRRASNTLQADAPTAMRCCRCSTQRPVAIVFDGGEFLGLITRIDLINHLRRA